MADDMRVEAGSEIVESGLDGGGPERPDLSDLPENVVAYIERLEAQLAAERARAPRSEGLRGVRDDAGDEAVTEAPTTIQVISISRQGRAKRSPRHFYSRQRRGGMGVFDLETTDPDQPAFLVLADLEAHLTVITNQGRAFRIAIQDLPETQVHSRGELISTRMPLREGEAAAIVFADPIGAGAEPGAKGFGTRSAYLSLVTARGQVRRIGNQYLGKNLQPGTVLYNVAEGGEPAACCWSSGNDDLVLLTAQGTGIRFSERQVPVRGCLGMRVGPQDRIVAAVACGPDDGFFMLTDEGKGTIRLMSGFSANKSPGAGGKTAMKADKIVGAVAIDAEQMESGTDLFAISRLGKIIRFSAGEVPPKEGVVQGVNCMNLRADECVALAGMIVAG